MSSLKRKNLRGLSVTINYVSPKTGFEQKVTLPGKYEICDRCRGSGTHVNPAIDENGISPQEFADDPEFEENYFAGVYDVRCEEGCDGGKIAVVEESRLTRFQKILFKAHENEQASIAEDRRLAAYERKMGY